ncbi:hypothetical protein [Kitasatospora sp. NPDC059160]|uniref:hypothetical protein n=1 Tax=unclassified Kitasatospora TaxID=2633591 RepID=UPI00369A7E5D
MPGHPFLRPPVADGGAAPGKHAGGQGPLLAANVLRLLFLRGGGRLGLADSSVPTTTTYST